MRRHLFAALLTVTACHPTERLVSLVDVPVATVPCVAGTLPLTRAAPVVMLALDRSGSMSSAMPGTTANRWQALTQALAVALPSADTLAMGALLYPNVASGALTCAAPSTPDLEPAVGNASAIVSLMKSTSPGGQTPTADALTAAASMLDERFADARARALVLATDGAPDCNATLDAKTCTCTNPGVSCVPTLCLDDRRTTATLAALNARGLPTWVIGIQDSGNTALLDVLHALAVAGGRPQVGATRGFYSAKSQAELEASLAAIRREVGGCAWLSNSVPDASGAIAVSVDGVTVPYDAAGVSGWQWGDQARGEVVFRGAACAAITAKVSPTVTATIVCGEGTTQVVTAL